MPQADGSIIIDTRINNKGAEADLKALQAKAKSTAQQISALDKEISKTSQKHLTLYKDLKSTEQQAKSTEKQLESINAQLWEMTKNKAAALMRSTPGMSDSAAMGQAASWVESNFPTETKQAAELQARLDKLNPALEELNQKYQEQQRLSTSLGIQRQRLSEQLGKENAAVKKQSQLVDDLIAKELEQKSIQERTDLFQSGDDAMQAYFSKQEASISQAYAKTQARQNKMLGIETDPVKHAEAVVQATQKEIAAQNRAAKAAEERATREEAAAKRRAAANETGTSTTVAKAYEPAKRIAAASTAIHKFGTRLTGIIAGALVFNVISSALTKMVGWFGSAMQSSDAFRQSLANLQGAASVAAAPLIDALGNALAYVINLLATAMSYLARFISMLTGKSLSAMKTSAKAMNSYGSAASNAAKETEKATRSLAGFDEITRLDAPQDNTSGSGAGSTAPNYDFVDAAGTGLASMAETIGKFLEPLKQIDLTPLKTALQGLLEAAKPLTQTLFAGLEWAWYNLFVPMAQWTVESALPAFLDVLAAGCRVLNAALQALAPLGQWLWDSFLQPIASWTGGMIVTVLEGVAGALQNVADWISRNQTLVQNIAVVLGSFAAAWGIVTTAVTLWNTVSALAAAATTALGAAVAFLTSPVGIAIAVIGSLIAAGVLLYQNWDVVKTKLSAAWESIRQAASSAWNAVGTTIQNVWNGITGTIKGAVNSIIGFINRMISGLCSGLNSMIGMLNKLKIDVPEGVPFLGGTQFGFHVATLTAPQIPYLAQGAVIPPNREFMAVLGDQSHGTNVEAPLATIQEAVVAVMQDYQDGNLAALGQVLATLREILSAIYGINIGDEVIGQAAARYQTRQSIITGRA